VVKDVAVDNRRSLALIRKLDRALGKKDETLPPQRVHLIRTSARRLEALLQNTQKENKHRKLRKRLKSLRREAGAVRDLDVQMMALANLNIGREQERKSRLMQALNDSRDERARELTKTLKGKKTRKMRTSLRRWRAEIDARSEHGGDLDPVPKALRMFASLSRQVHGWSVENLHTYRTRCKRIRYLAEMAGERPEANRVVEPLRRIQDAVGEWHDWLTLAKAAEKMFAGPVESGLVAALRNTTNAKFVVARTVCQESRRALLAQYREMLKHEREKKAVPKRKPQKAAVAVTRAAVA